MTAGIALDAIDAGLENLARQRRDFHRDRPTADAVPDTLARPSEPAGPPVGSPPPQSAPLAAFAAGLISHQAPPHDVLLDRQRLLEAERTLPERGELPLTDRLV
jgi:hypothetical protein